MNDALVKRLLRAGRHPDFTTCMEAADLIEQQARRIAELEAASGQASQQGVACKLCNSTGHSTPCAYPTEINRQQAKRIGELELDRNSWRALAEGAKRDLSAITHPTDSVQRRDAERYRWLRGEHFPTADKPPLAQVVWKAFDDRHSSDWANMIDGRDLDRAIDDALSQQASGEK